MTVRVVHDGPSVGLLGRLGRALAVVLGVLLLVVGMLALGLAALVAVTLLSGSSQDDSRRGALITGAAALAVAVVSVPIAVRLLRGRRRLVLFLRRFGFDDATSMVTFAATKVIGRSWRLVTLDDARVQPLGGSPGPRRAVGLVALITLVGLALGGYWLLGGGPDRLTNSTIAGTHSDDGSTGVGAAIGGILAGALVAALVLVFLLVVAIIMGVSSLFSLVSYGAARRGERAKSATITSLAELQSRSRELDRRSGRIFFPRLVVVRAADPVWQAAVRELAAICDAVVVDVSQASENLMWEIDTLLPSLGERCVLIGRDDMLAALTSGGRTSYDALLADALDGRTVLAYGTSGRDVRRFGRGLERFLLATARTRRGP